ncbi:hypothetical protein BS47DRAFT_225433 [Hydnum rufescens UP504]|uniref:Uncharacterized protein n=1 Tax=Hydnum rufescens UP504 TaxID=1448309 RepID=A0A9P6B7H6_9AGAM|nr:hypothetical protein BS47DRAFT_225433 [Hydnum rufescens UP504]
MDAEASDEVIGDLQPLPIASQSQSGPLESASGYGTMEQSQYDSRTRPSRPKAGLKRKIMSDIDEDETMEADPSTSHTRASKRVAHNSVNVIESRSQSPPRDETPLPTASKTAPGATFTSKGKSRGGAAETGVDTAPQFLQALASMKKGKRKEDEFDREFNNLRITLPKSGPGADLEKEKDRKEEMQAFDALEKDMNLRGNFMVVIESDDILRKDGGRKESTPVVENGKPNFKKFKKSLVGQDPSLKYFSMKRWTMVKEMVIGPRNHHQTFPSKVTPFIQHKDPEAEGPARNRSKNHPLSPGEPCKSKIRIAMQMRCLLQSRYPQQRRVKRKPQRRCRRTMSRTILTWTFPTKKPRPAALNGRLLPRL